MATPPPFDTPLVRRADRIEGPLRAPRQMLQEQEYGGHTSIHDDAMAEKLGFRAGPIEGPTHFSLFPPLLYDIWGGEVVRARVFIRALPEHGRGGRGNPRFRRTP